MKFQIISIILQLHSFTKAVFLDIVVDVVDRLHFASHFFYCEQDNVTLYSSNGDRKDDLKGSTKSSLENLYCKWHVSVKYLLRDKEPSHQNSLPVQFFQEHYTAHLQKLFKKVLWVTKICFYGTGHRSLFIWLLLLKVVGLGLCKIFKNNIYK